MQGAFGGVAVWSSWATDVALIVATLAQVITPATAVVIVELLALAIDGGVRGILEWQPAATSGCLTLSDDSDQAPGLGFADDSDLNGGVLADASQTV